MTGEVFFLHCDIKRLVLIVVDGAVYRMVGIETKARSEFELGYIQQVVLLDRFLVRVPGEIRTPIGGAAVVHVAIPARGSLEVIQLGVENLFHQVLHTFLGGTHGVVLAHDFRSFDALRMRRDALRYKVVGHDDAVSHDDHLVIDEFDNGCAVRVRNHDVDFERRADDVCVVEVFFTEKLDSFIDGACVIENVADGEDRVHALLAGVRSCGETAVADGLHVDVCCDASIVDAVHHGEWNELVVEIVGAVIGVELVQVGDDPCNAECCVLSVLCRSVHDEAHAFIVNPVQVAADKVAVADGCAGSEGDCD